MVHGREASDKDPADILDILERKGCLGELSVGDLCVDHLVDGRRDRGFGEVRQAARTSFDSVRHHEDSPFFGRRFGSRVAEDLLIDVLLRVRITIGIVEIAHERGAMMGGDEIDNRFGQVALSRQFFSFMNMRDNHLRRIAGIHLKERIIYVVLILYIVERIDYFSDIVVKRTCSYQECIRADCLRSLRREVRHLHGVLERTGCFFSELVQEIGVDIGQFDERN